MQKDYIQSFFRHKTDRFWTFYITEHDDLFVTVQDHNFIDCSTITMAGPFDCIISHAPYLSNSTICIVTKDQENKYHVFQFTYQRITLKLFKKQILEFPYQNILTIKMFHDPFTPPPLRFEVLYANDDKKLCSSETQTINPTIVPSIFIEKNEPLLGDICIKDNENGKTYTIQGGPIFTLTTTKTLDNDNDLFVLYLLSDYSLHYYYQYQAHQFDYLEEIIHLVGTINIIGEVRIYVITKSGVLLELCYTNNTISIIKTIPNVKNAHILSLFYYSVCKVYLNDNQTISLTPQKYHDVKQKMRFHILPETIIKLPLIQSKQKSARK